MKIHSFAIIAAIALVSCGRPSPKEENLSLAVISDVHVMAPELLLSHGAAFKRYLDNDRKLLAESPQLLDILTDRLIEASPDYVLVTGDLTKDGEVVSHEYFRDSCLSRLSSAGIKALVIPGNHDIRNPHARAFDGDSSWQVPSVRAEEFAEIYNDYGYGQAIARDSSSLSYMYQLTPGIRLLAIDACKYRYNDFSINLCKVGGVVRDETLSFIREQLDQARRDNMYVLCMMHHGLNEHWLLQNEFTPDFIIDNPRPVRRALRKGGVKYLFTGHYHSHDLCIRGGIYDMETGSMVDYPCPYRFVDIMDGKISVHSERIEEVPSDTGGVSFQDYAKEFKRGGLEITIGKLFPEVLPDDLREKVIFSCTDGFCENFRGDECISPERKTEIKELAKEIRKYSFKWSIVYRVAMYAMLHDSRGPDNEFEGKL